MGGETGVDQVITAYGLAVTARDHDRDPGPRLGRQGMSLRQRSEGRVCSVNFLESFSVDFD